MLIRRLVTVEILVDGADLLAQQPGQHFYQIVN